MAIQSLYPNIKPSLNLDFANVKALDPRITFVRTTTATYYDGITTAKAEENLLLQSQDFTTSWTAANSSVTANTEVAPDGTTTADTLTDNATLSLHDVHQAGIPISASTPYALSVFLKANTHNYVQLMLRDGSVSERYILAVFDLSAGTVSQTATGTSGTLTSSAITSVGNGWYRVQIVGSLSAVSNPGSMQFCIRFVNAASGNTFSSFGTSSYSGTETSFYLWGAQLEQRSAVTAYTPTTTEPITNYIPQLLTAPSGVARFNHNPTTNESLGLLVEEQRTNLLTYSDDFANAAWTKSDSVVSSNVVIAPDGNLTGDKLIVNSGVSTTGANSNGGVVQNPAGTTAIAYSYSFYAKAAEVQAVRVRETVTTGARANISLINGSVVYESGSSSNFTVTTTSVGNGWWRIVLVRTPATTLGYVIKPGIDTGDGYSGIYVWGAQLEAGAFPTSYIPTVASTVTRNADAASMTGTNFSSWYRPDQGALYWEGAGVDAFGRTMLSISDNTTNNRIRMVWTTSNARSISTEIVAINGFQGSVPTSISSITAGKQYKLGFAYAVNDLAGSRDGGSVGTDTSALIPVVDRMYIGAGPTGAFEYFSGTIKKIAYYPSRLSNAQLQALTTI